MQKTISNYGQCCVHELFLTCSCYQSLQMNHLAQRNHDHQQTYKLCGKVLPSTLSINNFKHKKGALSGMSWCSSHLQFLSTFTGFPAYYRSGLSSLQRAMWVDAYNLEADPEELGQDNRSMRHAGYRSFHFLAAWKTGCG